MGTYFLSILFAINLSGCSTRAIIIKEQNRSLRVIQRIIQTNMPSGVRIVSSNSREYSSDYFAVGKDSHFNPSQSQYRSFAKVIILGDRRPYEISVQVYVEQRVDQNKETNGDYHIVGTDRKATEKIAKLIEDELDKSRAEMNVIDDFRPF